ncbi:heterodisulfide reductase-related iron-sulfur binding cluster [Hydrogenobacter hydrogenophilus]|uniref:Glycerol-3-phosphate dehydrogenase, anaerobic, C subunit n=1 Tax=Hydrogenobacter hydrogenophilus TaxID=35835 RepID=A0A285NWY9_9AQUI|nr:heterodisulfide reductase-related iron-sulfur binding cluster [Hydrogenobacter hydrogenophilus]SNZ13728.1 glycerol-3-phosphate dehydrogenase, anaerobic, C subunit [Hydrogenobacter hydrogenophilus]
MQDVSLGGVKDFNFDIKDPKFLDEDALWEEAKRVFSKCKDCRMCISYCPSFPALFDAVDRHDDDINALSKEELAKPLELCFHCKQCYFKCPYTPPHEWRIDFPHLSLRYKIWKFKKEGAKLTDKLMLNTDLVGKLSVGMSSLVNSVKDVKPVRVIMENFMGVDRRAKLPPFNSETFVDWFEKNRKKVRGENGKVALFYTCLLNYNYLEKGKALVRVFEKNDILIELPQQECCGIPFFDIGDVDAVIKKAKANIKSLKAYVDKGYDIVVPIPTCALQIKYEYPLLLPDDPNAKAVAEKVYDVHQYLWKLYEEGKLNKEFKVSMGNIAYHIPCHLKSLNVGYKAANLMRLIPNTKVRIVERCSGHDGTFGVRKETFDMAYKVGSKLFEELKGAQADLYVSDCPLASNQIELGTGRRPLHPIEVLWKAYGEEA